MKTLTSGLVALALALGGGVAMAQPAGDDVRIADNKPRGAKRDRVKQRIRIMRALVLTEQLGLDDAGAAKMFPVLDRYDDEVARLLAERATLRTRLAAARRASKPVEIGALLDQLVANQRARWTAEEQRFADLRGLLTPEQAATLLDLLPEVDRKILRGLQRAVDLPDDGARRGPGLRGGELDGNPLRPRK